MHFPEAFSNCRKELHTVNPLEQGSYEKSPGTEKNGKAWTSGNMAIKVEGSNWFQVNKKARRQDFRPYLGTQHSSRFHTPLLNTQTDELCDQMHRCPGVHSDGRILELGLCETLTFLSPWSVLLLELEKSQGQFVPFVNFSLDRKAENFHDYYTHRSHAWSKIHVQGARHTARWANAHKGDLTAGLLSRGRNRSLWLQPSQ